MGFIEIIQTVAEQAGLTIESVDARYLKCEFEAPGGRRQIVHLFPVGELSGLQVVRISTPILELPHGRLHANVAEGLLRENSQMKIGSFGVEEVDGHKLLTLQHNMILETLDPEELFIVVGALAVTGDQWEKQLSGPDRF